MNNQIKKKTCNKKWLEDQQLFRGALRRKWWHSPSMQKVAMKKTVMSCPTRSRTKSNWLNLQQRLMFGVGKALMTISRAVWQDPALGSGALLGLPGHWEQKQPQQEKQHLWEVFYLIPPHSRKMDYMVSFALSPMLLLSVWFWCCTLSQDCSGILLLKKCVLELLLHRHSVQLIC